jgi:hypothetical protein
MHATSPTSPTAAAAAPTSITVCPVPVAVIGSRVDLASNHRLMSVAWPRLPVSSYNMNPDVHFADTT